MLRTITRLIHVGFAAGLVMAPELAGAQGFGMVKKNVTLVRSLPPVISLANARVALHVSGVGACAATLDDLVRAKVAAFVFSNNSLAEDTNNPDRVIEVNLTECYMSDQIDRKDGTQLVKGTIRASYRTIDKRTQKSLDAANLTADYDRRFAAPQNRQQQRPGVLGALDKVGGALSQATGVDPNQPPNRQELTTRLVEQLATAVAQRVVTMDEKLEVPLPRGKLDQAASLGQAGRWGAMLEQLEQTAQLPSDADAYRLYGIGVASEALAYATSDRSVQRDLIARASQEYKAAIRLKPDESEFRRAETRIASSLAALDVTAAGSPAVSGAAAQPVATRGAGGSEWTNAAVIELFKEGLKEKELIEAIRGAKSPAFDVDSPTGLLQLTRAGLPAAVISAMREKMKVGAAGS
jgi:hypothetical protein